MSSELVAWLTSFIWLVAIFGLWWTSLKQYERIRAQELLIRTIYEKNNHSGLHHDSQTYLKLLARLGWEQVSFETRRDILSSLRAEAQADKQKLATYIEMMPQMGLLGTVLSLFLSAFFFDFNMKMLGMALATTAFGLVGSLVARNWFELPSERHFYGIIAMLEDEQVTKELLALHQEHIPNKTNITIVPIEDSALIEAIVPIEDSALIEAIVPIEDSTPDHDVVPIAGSVPIETTAFNETIIPGETATPEDIIEAKEVEKGAGSHAPLQD